MIRLRPEQTARLINWFLPERPDPSSLIGLHVIHTGNGACVVDRWPAPRVVLVETARNYALIGEAPAVVAADLQPHIKGFVGTSKDFEPLLRAAFSEVNIWPRVNFEQQKPPALTAKGDHLVRRLEPSDAYQFWGLEPEVVWISKTWGGPMGLASRGFGWGAFVAGQLASVACTFFLGEVYEEIGVVTAPRFRGMGLSTACGKALCDDIRARGHRPSWTTSPENIASIRVAEKLGFKPQRNGVLYVVDQPIPWRRQATMNLPIDWPSR